MSSTCVFCCIVMAASRLLLCCSEAPLDWLLLQLLERCGSERSAGACARRKKMKRTKFNGISISELGCAFVVCAPCAGPALFYDSKLTCINSGNRSLAIFSAGCVCVCSVHAGGSILLLLFLLSECLLGAEGLFYAGVGSSNSTTPNHQWFAVVNYFCCYFCSSINYYYFSFCLFCYDERRCLCFRVGCWPLRLRPLTWNTWK